MTSEVKEGLYQTFVGRFRRAIAEIKKRKRTCIKGVAAASTAGDGTFEYIPRFLTAQLLDSLQVVYYKILFSLSLSLVFHPSYFFPAGFVRAIPCVVLLLVLRRILLPFPETLLHLSFFNFSAFTCPFFREKNRWFTGILSSGVSSATGRHFFLPRSKRFI